VLDTSYQKGVLAHTSFSESSYQNFLEKLVNAGYRVARVVQTETQEQFKERKKISEENEPGVLAREVCCVATRGTM
jgi:DNA mismatch repair ATPase MutS